MQIIITNSFKKDFYKIFKADNVIKNFVEILKYKNNKLINLKFPYQKFRFKIIGIDLRGITYIGFDDIIIPIYISKKSNKKHGMNLILNKEIEKILENNLKLVLSDIKLNLYKIY